MTKPWMGALLLWAAAACEKDSLPVQDAGTPAPAHCERGYDDVVSRALCVSPAPEIGSLVELERALGFDPELEDGDTTVVALNSNSASIVARTVNVLNPRLLMFRARIGAPDPEFIALGFTRGEPLVELVVRDASSLELRFYLVRFERACTYAAGGCSVGESIGEQLERDWTRTEVFADEDLRNTPLDCLRCHQPDGPGTPKLLRMQELGFPWTHWMTSKTQEGGALLDEFKAAHAPAERYGGVLVERLAERLAPQLLEALIRDEAFAPQPNEFESAIIAEELSASAEEQSSTWNALYARAISAQAIPVPYRKLRATDAQRQASATAAYRAFVEGRGAADELIDLRDLLSLDAERSMNIRPRAGASGGEMIVQICGGCHNSRLDQSLSRARFDAEQFQASKQAALSRLRLDPSQPGAMPPPIAAYLSDEERAAIMAAF